MDPLATAADLNLHLQRTVPDDLAALLLAGASGAVRAYCRWNISRTTETFDVIGDGRAFITLPTLRLRDVTEIRVDGIPVDLATASPAPIWSAQGQIYWGALWARNAKLQIDVDHGYDAAEMPDLIRLVVLTLAGRQLNNPDGVKRATTGQVTREYFAGADLTELHMRLLDQYRI